MMRDEKNNMFEKQVKKVVERAAKNTKFILDHMLAVRFWI